MFRSGPASIHPDSSSSRVQSGAPTDEDCIVMLQWMLRHDTTALQSKEEGFVELLAHYLSDFGIASQILQGDHGRANLVASIESSQPGSHLVFCGHCDTVPLGDRSWSRVPFGAVIDGDRIYGRGSSDMKGGLAALIASFLDMRNNSDSWAGRISLAVTYGEETGSEGARRMAEDGSLGPFDAMVIAEPTLNKVVRSHKGALWLSVTATGRTGHGSMPHMGLNALEMIVKFKERLSELNSLSACDPLLGKPTICLTQLHGGAQVNVIPDNAIAEFDMRTLPSQCHDKILAEIEAIARQVESDFTGGNLVVEIMNSLPALATPVDSAIVCAALETKRELGMDAGTAFGASYFTDGSVLQTLGSDILILGPGDPAEAHQTDENLRLPHLFAARLIFTGIARRILASPDP